jgi:hypothetical protein
MPRAGERKGSQLPVNYTRDVCLASAYLHRESRFRFSFSLFTTFVPAKESAIIAGRGGEVFRMKNEK